MQRRTLLSLFCISLCLVPALANAQHPVGGSATVNGKTQRVAPHDQFMPRTGHESLPQLITACWLAEGSGKNRDATFDQYQGKFTAEVVTRWCRSTLKVNGPADRVKRGGTLSSIDTLDLRLRTDTIDFELSERAGRVVHATLNQRVIPAEWWSGIRERVLGLARVPTR